MKPRHKAREVALQILYRYDVAQHSVGTAIPAGSELAADLTRHFAHWGVPEESREFAAQLVAGTLSEIELIDRLLEEHAANWKVARMGLVDRSILRMAVYEMKQFPETTPSVIIDEAIELGKQFGTADTASFVNGLLDAVKPAVRA